MRLVMLAVLALASPAYAEPTSCRTLQPQPFSQLSSYAQRRFPNGASWEARKEAWKPVKTMVIVDRAPHIARAAVEACPGIRVVSVNPADGKRQTSYVEVMTTAFAPLSRLAQLPAVRSISPRDTRVRFDFQEDLIE